MILPGSWVSRQRSARKFSYWILIPQIFPFGSATNFTRKHLVNQPARRTAPRNVLTVSARSGARGPAATQTGERSFQAASFFCESMDCVLATFGGVQNGAATKLDTSALDFQVATGRVKADHSGAPAFTSVTICSSGRSSLCRSGRETAKTSGVGDVTKPARSAGCILQAKSNAF